MPPRSRSLCRLTAQLTHSHIHTCLISTSLTLTQARVHELTRDAPQPSVVLCQVTLCQVVLRRHNPLLSNAPYSMLIDFREGSKTVLNINFALWEVYYLNIGTRVVRRSMINFK